jgi:hypothetical protein
MRKREFEEIEIFCRMCSHQKGHCHQCVSDRYQEIAILSLKGETARKVHKFHTNKWWGLTPKTRECMCSSHPNMFLPKWNVRNIAFLEDGQSKSSQSRTILRKSAR